MPRAVVVGRSAAALEEYAAARRLCDFDLNIVVGKTGEVFPDRIDHWVSFHADLFPVWAARRAAAALPPAARCWCATHRGRKFYSEGIAMPAPVGYVVSSGGSSGFMAAVDVALDELALDRIVLAGVPMSAEGGHLEQASSPHEVGKPWGEADKYWPTWEANLPRMLGRIKSMSGRTREALGAPTCEWLGTA